MEGGHTLVFVVESITAVTSPHRPSVRYAPDWEVLFIA